jgi:hypothetical protein
LILELEFGKVEQFHHQVHVAVVDKLGIRVSGIALNGVFQTGLAPISSSDARFLRNSTFLIPACLPDSSDLQPMPRIIAENARRQDKEL